MIEAEHPLGIWTSHTGEDYSVVMRPDETTDSASVRVFGEDAPMLARRIEARLNAVFHRAGEERSTENVDDAWQCGDAKYRAQAVLRIIVDNTIRDDRVIDRIDDLLHEAGKRFVLDMLADEVPL